MKHSHVRIFFYLETIIWKNLGGPQIKRIVVKTLVFLNICDKNLVNTRNVNKTFLLAFIKTIHNCLIHIIWTHCRFTNKYHAALFLIHFKHVYKEL